MAFIIKDRVKENTTTTGTGAISLGGAAATFDTFQSYMVNGDTTYYAIVSTETNTDEWEVGLGTWNTGNTLTRTTVLTGSNGTNAVDFGSGNKDIFMTYPAAHAALAGDDVDFANITVSGTVDGRDVAADGTKLDTIETNADVTDAVNVAAAGALMKSGGTMTGALILNADPTTALGAATKEYVDTIAAAGIHYHTPVRVESPDTAGNLNATYDNGTSGVGATLTNAGTQAALVIDGVTLNTNDRVLIYSQTNAYENGIYTVTNTGSASTNWVLTRATDADSYGASDPNALGEGDAYFVKEGNTGAGELYVMNTSGVITFGTTAINFTVIAETAVYSAGTGLTLTGTTFSIGQDVDTTANVTFNQVTAAIIGNVTGNVTGNVSGNAGTATKLATARTIQLSGDVTGSASFDGSANINITAAVQDNSHAHVISNVDGLQAALDDKVPTTRTLTAGNGLTGGGDLSANRTFSVGAGSGITVGADTVSHAATSSQASVNNSGRTYIQDITLDPFGHVTGLTSATETVTDTNQLTTFQLEDGDGTEVTISHGKEVKFVEGGGIDINWTDTDNGTDGDPYDLTFTHADTSNQASVDNSNGTVIQDVTLDGYGHVTGLGSVDLDSRYVNVTGDTMTGSLNIGDAIGSRDNTLSIDGDANSSPIVIQCDTVDNAWGILPWVSGETYIHGGVYYDDGSWVHRSSNTTNYLLRLNGGTGAGWYASNNSSASWNVANNVSLWNNSGTWIGAVAKSPTLTLTGDASGSATFTNLGNATLSVTVANDSHNHDTQYTSIDEFDWRGTGYLTSTTTSALKTELLNRDVFDSYVSAFKTGWSYAGNGDLTDAGRLTELAGTSWLTWTDNSTDNTQGNFTALVIAPNTGGSAGKMFVYNDQGSSYAPGWREIWTSLSDGSGSGLDADLLDGNHASAFQAASTALGYIDVATGNYGTIKVDDDRGVTWGGYAIRDDWVFMSNGAAEAGIYNDTDNEWGIKFFQNARTALYYNADEQFRTESAGVSTDGGMRIGAFGNSHNPNALEITGSEAEKIVLSGTSDPYIRWQEGTTDRFYIQWRAASNAPMMRNQESADFDIRGNSGVSLRLRDDADTIRGYVHANTSNNIGFLDQGGSWAIKHINDQGTYFYTDGTTEEFKVGRDTVSGDYGTVETRTTKNNYSGYSINGQWVFMSSGAGLSGIFNDTDNEWAAIFRQNAEVELFHNGSMAMETVDATGIRVGSTTSSNIYMQDTDHGERRIHCNSNRLGFLNSSAAWSFWSDDAGDIECVGGANFGNGTLTADGQNDVFLFATSATSATAQSGAFHNKLRILGGSSQTRDLQLYQVDSEYAHIGSSYTSNQLTIDSAFTQVTFNNNLQINSHVIDMDLNNIADNAIELREVRDSTWPFVFVTNDVGNDNHSGFWVGSNGYPDMRLRRDDGTVRALISSWERSYVSNGFSISGDTLDMNNNTITNVEDIYLNDRIYHNGDTDTYIQFEGNDIFRIVIAGAELQEWGNNYTRLNDSDTLRLGSGSDFQMWHDGTNNYFRNYHHANGNIYFQGENTSGTNHALVYMYCDTSRTHVRLYENNTERLRTTSTGITVYGDVNSTSDIRYKKNVETIDNAVDKVKTLRGVTFDWNNEAFEASGEEVEKPNFTQRATGVIAQDVEKVLPEAVRENEDGFKNVAYGNMVGLLIEAIKEQQEQIDMLTQKLNEMENK